MTTEQIKRIQRIAESIVDKKLNESSNGTKMVQMTINPISSHLKRVESEARTGKLTGQSLSYLIDAIEKNLPKLKLLVNKI
jgi:hypothetical protein